MGSFNVACGISNIGINEGEDIGFVILRRNKSLSGRNQVDETGFAYYTYATDVFSPFLAPVFGEYGDYGNIENIQSSCTTAILESIFHRPVASILACITSDDYVYSRYGKLYATYFTGNRDWDEREISIGDALSMLGFEHYISGSSESRSQNYVFGTYKLVYGPKTSRYGGPAPVNVWSIVDLSTDTVIVPSFDGRDAMAVMNKFCKVTGVFPGFDQNDYKAIALLDDLYGMFFLKDVFDKMRDSVSYGITPSRSKSLQDKWDIVAQEMKVTEGNDFLDNWEVADDLSSITRNLSLPNNLRNELRGYGETYELLETHALISLMGLVNRMFAPTVCGTQHGDDKVSKKLNAVTDAILTKRIAEWDD